MYLQEQTLFTTIFAKMSNTIIDQNSTVNEFCNLEKLNIIAWNCNSIYSNERRDYLNDFILEHKPDILLLSETKLNVNCTFEIQNYITLRNDRPIISARNSGGTAILIKRQYAHTHINIPSILNFKYLETSIILIKMPRNKNLYIISTYASTTDSSDFTTEFNSLFHRLNLHQINNYYIIAGDLNARHKNWMNPVNNCRGITVNSWLENNFTQFRCRLYHSSLPTFHRGTSFIDLAIADGRIKFHRTQTTNTNNDRFGLLGLPSNSDHDAIKMIVSINHEMEIPLQNISGRLKFESVNWPLFTRRLSNLYHSAISSGGGNGYEITPSTRNLSNAEIDDYLKQIENLIVTNINRTVKTARQVTGSNKYTNSTIKLLKYNKNLVIKELHLAKCYPNQFSFEKNQYLNLG